MRRGPAGNKHLDFPGGYLHWNFVYQRPQHLMSRYARDRRVFYREEPVHHDAGPWLQVTHGDDGVTLIVPHLPSMDPAEAEPALREPAPPSIARGDGFC